MITTLRREVKPFGPLYCSGVLRPLAEIRSEMQPPLSRRTLIRQAAGIAAALLFPPPALACSSTPAPTRRILRNPDRERLASWTQRLTAEGLTRQDLPLGRSIARVGDFAAGSPYEPFTLEEYLRKGGSPAAEPLTLSLTRFDCVTLVEACLAVSRVASTPSPGWEEFGREVERMRYRNGLRRGYTSRLHYFSEWISDGARRGLVRDLGTELGGAEDNRPLRFMTQHRPKYPALQDEAVFQEIQLIERSLDTHPRKVIPTKRIPEVVERIQTGDVLAFATGIAGLDVTHSALAYRDEAGSLRVLHAPLSGGVVEVTRFTLPEYVAAIRHATGILVARPLRV
jgi:N-acetylmuramoyl-L-alanine amidase-like